MPIPEPGIYRPSNLTKAQQQAQLAAVYGVSMEQLTHAEIERMRAIVASHDGERKPMTTIDLNNPPKQSYRFQKFPMMLYDLENSHPSHEEERPSKTGFGVEVVHVAAVVRSTTVNSEEELQQALAEGWSQEAPGFSEESEQPLSPKLQKEVDQVQERVARTRRHKGSEAA